MTYDIKTIILIFSVPKSQNSNEEEKNYVSNHGEGDAYSLRIFCSRVLCLKILR